MADCSVRCSYGRCQVREVFGLALGFGSIALLGWIAAAAVAGSVDGWEGVDPDTRFGVRGRRLVAATFGSGMAGLSAAYAGWPMVVATVAALVGAAVAVLVASR